MEHERYYSALLEAIQREDLLEDARFNTTLEAKKNAPEFIKIIDEGFIKFTRDEMVERLERLDIAHEKIQHVQEVLTDPQAIANNYVFEFENRDKSKNMMASTPVKLGNIEVNIDKDAPTIGQHNDEVLKEIGYSDEEIKEFYEKNILSKK